MEITTMNGATVVLGGWAFSPRILSPIFGPDAIYVDINPLMPKLTTANSVRENWQSTVAEVITERGGNTIELLAGWSAGAIMALGAVELIRPRTLALFSPTLSFCESSVNPHGWSPTVVKSMIRQMKTDPEAVLQEFRAKCDPPGPLMLSGCTTQDLIAGLRFLLHAVVDLPDFEGRATIVNGSEDLIVPEQSSECVEPLTEDIQSVNEGHLFFLHRISEIRTSIECLLEDDDPFL